MKKNEPILFEDAVSFSFSLTKLKNSLSCFISFGFQELRRDSDFTILDIAY
jgi:hypothetical protein